MRNTFPLNNSLMDLAIANILQNSLNPISPFAVNRFCPSAFNNEFVNPLAFNNQFVNPATLNNAFRNFGTFINLGTYINLGTFINSPCSPFF